MYKLNVSPEHLAAFAYSTEKFKNRISNEYEQLQQNSKEFQCRIDDVTGDAFKLPIQKIGSIISKQCEELDTIIKDVNAYTDKIRMILHKMELHKNILKEKVCATVCATVIHKYIRVSDSEYQTVDGYLIDKAHMIKSIADLACETIKALSGSEVTPSFSIDDLVNDIIKSIDGHLAIKPLTKKIDRSGTKIPQAQIDSHILVIDDVNEPWKK